MTPELAKQLHDIQVTVNDIDTGVLVVAVILALIFVTFLIK